MARIVRSYAMPVRETRQTACVGSGTGANALQDWTWTALGDNNSTMSIAQRPTLAAALLGALLVLILTASPAPAKQGDELPLSLLGITLGEDMAKYSGWIEQDTAMPMRDAPFLSEATLKPGQLPGIRGGSLTYGNCAKPGRLLRIKLKFADRSKKLFDKLLVRYQKQFGMPQNWLGDPFHVVMAWEWVFTRGEREVRLVLMHSNDPEVRPGVSIKMTLQSLWQREYECWKKSFPDHAKETPAMRGLDSYVPR